jgi:DNA-binding MarR family transcriptional regulator
MRPEETVDYHIKSSWLSISRMYNHLASKHHLTQAVAYALMIIDQESGTPATKIGPMMGMEATGMSRLLKSMEEEELIYRKRDKNDKRKVRIYLSNKGLEKRKKARSVVKKFNSKILDKVSEKEFKTFVGVINKVQLVVDQYKTD